MSQPPILIETLYQTWKPTLNLSLPSRHWNHEQEDPR
jgi:hypothetical protein